MPERGRISASRNGICKHLLVRALPPFWGRKLHKYKWDFGVLQGRSALWKQAFRGMGPYAQVVGHYRMGPTGHWA